VQHDVEAVLGFVDVGRELGRQSAPIKAWSPNSSQACISQSWYLGSTGASPGASRNAKAFTLPPSTVA